MRPQTFRPRGWCDKHYKRWRRHGNPETALRPPLGIPDEYLEEVRWLLDQGETPERAAQRAGVTVSAVSRSAYRRGDRELAAQFSRIQSRVRRAKS